MSWVGVVLQFEFWLMLVSLSWEYCTHALFEEERCEMSGVVIATHDLGHEWGKILYDVPRTWLKINRAIIVYGLALYVLFRFMNWLGGI